MAKKPDGIVLAGFEPEQVALIEEMLNSAPVDWEQIAASMSPGELDKASRLLDDIVVGLARIAGYFHGANCRWIHDARVNKSNNCVAAIRGELGYTDRRHDIRF